MRSTVSKISALFIVLLMVVAFQGCAKKNSTTADAMGEGQQADNNGNNGISDALLDEVRASLTDVYFEFDQYSLTSAAKNAIAANAKALSRVTGASILLEGHCDERGSNEYNLALGDKRAQTVKAALVSSGLPDVSVSTISYGKEKPQCTANNESCWQLNRRVHIVIK